ncbi:PREDICTED: mucin-5AC [Habropoda laboriosa]|uniref:mucin-5AC n=1 Tax=Habropoda laboriosa TaxID=597456 RepID=UPI00083D4CEE|nr:PREDICTED: mucin-5AC [Habropoda laboriosa]
MWFKAVLLVSCVIACTLAENASKSTPVSVGEFVTSHKLPESIARPSDFDEEDDDVVDVERKTASKDGKHAKKVIPKLETFDKKQANLDPVRRFDFIDEDKADTTKRQVRVELENFSDTGVLQEDGIRRTDTHRSRLDGQRDSVIPGVRVSDEYPTTMMPVLTTPREARAFDFVPVNIIRDDGKETSFRERNFGDFSDVSLVPAGTNSRIQVKKGPNGKDYEYEYVYYYYDEEDENKAGTADSAVTNSYDVPSRTTPAPRRGGSSTNRNKYSSAERSSTVEPASNEVIPNRNGNNRSRQLIEAEDVSEERLPTNTRFPPRSRSNHNTGTTESTRTRGNRPRPGLDLVDSSSFRTHQEGPEFPQVLPKGPVRFLGVTPNEENGGGGAAGEEKPATRGRGRPQRVQEPAPVEEIIEDVPAPTTRRRPSVTTLPTEDEVEPTRGQLSRATEEKEDEKGETSPVLEKQVSSENKQENEEQDYSSASTASSAGTESPTTEYPSSMDKVALDLYAFVQQGQNNLVDASSSEATDTSSYGTTLSNDESTTDFTAVTELSATTLATEPTTTTIPTSVTELTTTTTTPATTTTPTTTTTTTTEPPTTTTTQAPAGRGKFRRPGIGGGAGGSRNRYKSNGSGSTTTTESPAEPTQRTRGRFGSNGSNGGGFKRNRPGHKQSTVEEDAVQKESSSAVQAERPSSGTRNRFRGTGGTRSVSTTTSAPSNGGSTASSNGPSGISRPSFNKLNINRRRGGRPSTTTPNASEESQESTKETAQEAVTAAPKSTVRSRLPATGARPVIKPGARVNLRPKPGQSTTTTTTTPIPAENSEESSIDEPAGEGTEEETHEAPAETSPPPSKSTTVNPLNKLRNRNRLQVHPKTTTRSPVPLASRRSPLLPRRKVTEAPVPQASQEEVSEEPDASSETETTEATSAETSTAASTKHEETRGLGGLLAPRRRITPRRPGQIISRE